MEDDMKTLLALVALALTFTVNAARINANSDWSDIVRAHGYEADFPQVRFEGGSVFSSIYGKCQYTNDDGVKMIRGGRYERCLRWEHRGDNDRCVDSEMIILETPATYTAKECTRWTGREHDTCASYRTVTRSYPLSMMVNVYRVSGRDDNRTSVAFKKSFSVPACN